MSTYVPTRSWLLLFVCAVVCIVIPTPVSANVQASVVGLLPPETTRCAAVGVSEVIPFIYDGSLHSFEVSITDPSYVAIGAQVGNVPIDFHYITRRINPDGTLRIHVDVASTPAYGSLPVSITLLSARADLQITCVLQISEIVSHGTLAPTPALVPRETTTEAPGRHVQIRPPAHGGVGIVGSTTSTSTVKTPPQTPNTVFVGALHSLGTVCTKTSSWKLWAILLVLYVLFVLALALQAPETLTDGSRGWNVVLILVLLIALLALWYLSASCRAGPWAPIGSILIAAAGIRALMQKPPTPPQVLLLDK